MKTETTQSILSEPWWVYLEQNIPKVDSYRVG